MSTSMREWTVVVRRMREEMTTIHVEARTKADAYIEACEAADADKNASEYEWETLGADLSESVSAEEVEA